MRHFIVLAVLAAFCIALKASPVKNEEDQASELDASFGKTPKIEQISGGVAEGNFNKSKLN